nr:probable prolyl 4-hydroxylase 7 [Tanacetum cinerariifolium]
MNCWNSFILFFLCLNILLPNFTLLSSGIPDIRSSVIRLPNDDSYGHPFDPSRVIRISWHPRAFLYKKFLADEECDHLIKMAKDKLEKSMVADVKTGNSIESTVRTSKGMFIRTAQDEVVGRIESRISVWTFLPVENGEAIQVLHYENGQKYLPHWDYFLDKTNQALGGHRIVTVLMYLSNVEKGGETIFPLSEMKESQPKTDEDSECATKGYAVKPKKGDALLFFSLHPNATVDPLSLHGSCPVIEGEKWLATKWIHVRSFERKRGRTPKLLTLEIHHGGCFTPTPSKSYVGGHVSSFNVVDIDEFCLHDLKDIIVKLGYGVADLILNVDADVLEMAKYVKDYKIILVYVEHGSSNGDTSIFITPKKGVAIPHASSVEGPIVVESVDDPFEDLDEILGYANTRKQVIEDDITVKQMVIHV